MLRRNYILLPLTAATALVLSGCESDGSSRIASVGTNGSVTSQAEDGNGGSSNGNSDGSGTTGDGSGAAGDGSAGGSGGDGMAGLAGNNVLATGGLIGTEGVAGTGLLANTGDTDNQSPVIANVLTESGELVNIVAGETMRVASVVGDDLVADDTIVGTVIGVVEDTGTALVRTGNGEEYLIDGLVAAPGEAITANIGESVLLGSEEATPLIGVSVLSMDQITGSLATVGLDSAGNLINVDLALNDGTLGAENGLTGNVLGGTDGLVGGVTSTVNGATDTLGVNTGDVTGSVDGLLNGGTDSSLGSTVGGVVDNTVGGVTGGTTGNSSGTGDGLLGGSTGSLGDSVGGTVDGVVGGLGNLGAR